MSSSNGFRVQMTVELGHHASTRKKPTPEGFTHDWTVFVRGPDGSKIHYFIEKVVFHLHDTFAKPKRVVKEPPYSVSESGYAGFIINIEIYFKNKENPKKVSINYDLFLPAEGFEPINHTHCEKLTFQNPTEEFRSKLLKAGGVEYPIGRDPPSQPFTDLFGPPILGDGKKCQNQSTSGKEKDKSCKYKTPSSTTPDASKCTVPQSTHVINTPSATPGVPPIASKDIKKSKETTAQKRMSKSPSEQTSGKKIKRHNSIDSKEKREKHKNEKQQKEKKSEHSETTESKTSTAKSDSSKRKSKDTSDHVKMKDGIKKHKSDKDHSFDLKPQNHTSSNVSKSVGEVKKKPEKQDSPQIKADDTDSSSDSDSLLSSKAVSDSCSSPLSSLSEDDEDVQMVMSIIAESPDISKRSPEESQKSPDVVQKSPDVSKKHKSTVEVVDTKLSVIKSDSKSTKSRHNSHSSTHSKKSSQSKPIAKSEIISKTDSAKIKSSSKTELSSKSESSIKTESSSKSESFSKSESLKSETKSDVSKHRDSKEVKNKKDKLPTTPSKTLSKSKDVKDSKHRVEPKSVKDKCVNGDIPENAPNGEKIVDLLAMQRTIMTLRDRTVLQQVVNLISKTGLFDVTEETFDFDLCKLDIGTVNKIKKAISQTS